MTPKTARTFSTLCMVLAILAIAMCAKSFVQGSIPGGIVYAAAAAALIGGYVVLEKRLLK